jgi:hypothetical protein
MSDRHEQDTWDQDEVEIVDLGAPDRGLSRHVFTLGAKWRAVAPFRSSLVAPLVALALLIAILQPGSSGVNTRTSGAPHSVPGDTLPSTIYLIDCGITINVNDLPPHVYTWEQVMSTPSTEECSFFSHPGSKCPTPQQLSSTPPANQRVGIVCSTGTPLPVPSGTAGKNR